MLRRSFRSASLLGLAALTIAACAPATGSVSQRHVASARIPPLTPTSRVIDAERISRSGAQTAWDAVRLLVPSYRFQAGRLSSLRAFGAPDARHFESSIRLIVDGHEMRDLGALNVIPARELIAIHVLNATEATTYFGPGNGGGAIVIQTRTFMRVR